MKPYYATDDGAIRIFHARWEDVLAAGVFKPKDVTLIHADPPYGVKERTDRRSKGRGFSKDKQWPSRDFAPVHGDDQQFDPAPLLALDRPLILWGANHYSDRVPGSSSWFFWDKRDGTTPDDNADGEVAWTNLGGPLRIFRHLWRGLCRGSEAGERVLAPTQKPEALVAWEIEHAKVRKVLRRGDLLFVPYMGSGPELRPALAAGLRVIACEVAVEYCRTAVNARLRAVADGQSTSPIGPLFNR